MARAFDVRTVLLACKFFCLLLGHYSLEVYFVSDYYDRRERLSNGVPVEKIVRIDQESMQRLKGIEAFVVCDIVH